MHLEQRQLDPYERFLWLPPHEYAFNQCIAIGFEGKLSANELSQAARILQKDHPMLCVGVKDEHKPYYSYNQVGEIAIRIVTNDDSHCWKKEIEKELHTPIPYEPGPLLRMVLINHKFYSVLLLTAHHLITDGISLTYIITELTRIIAAIREGKILENSPHLPPPPLSSFFSKKSKSLNITTAIFKPKNKSVENRCKHDKLTTGVIFKETPLEKLSYLTENAKKQNLRLQSCFLSSALLALANKIKNQENQLLSIIYECPVNMRPFLNPQILPNQLGCYVSTLCFQKNINNRTSYLKLAAEINTEIHSQLNNDLPEQTLKIVKKLIKNRKSFETLKNARNPGCPFVGVSNLGRLSFPKQSNGLNIKFIFPTVALHGTFYQENNIYLALITIDNKLFSSLMYPKPLMSEFAASSLMDNFINSLKLFARQ